MALLKRIRKKDKSRDPLVSNYEHILRYIHLYISGVLPTLRPRDKSLAQPLKSVPTNLCVLHLLQIQLQMISYHKEHRHLLLD
ncbi:hypothetical protein TWF481_006336 [Arthrobotrys musiformis]|uniref:Uncharacterized protein n=1 Tax=Arthrobotrys musiformis TaxID=47236 RepID=A0AAV9WGC8_9PEZI